jgi:hypothetical protein
MHWNGEDERVYGTKIICVFFFPSSVHYLPPWFLFFPSFLVVEVFLWCRSAICPFDVRGDRLGYNTEGKNAGIVECWYD